MNFKNWLTKKILHPNPFYECLLRYSVIHISIHPSKELCMAPGEVGVSLPWWILAQSWKSWISAILPYEIWLFSEFQLWVQFMNQQNHSDFMTTNV